MKYKLSALILGLTFAGVSQAGVLTFNYTFGTNVFAPSATFTSGDTLSAFTASGGGSGTITNMQTGTSQVVTLYTLTWTPAGTTNNAGNTITATDTLTITSPGTTSPSAVSFITAAFLDSVTGGNTSTVSDTIATTTVATYLFAGNGYKLTVTPLQFTTLGPTGSNTPQTITVQATFALTAPEPGTWVLLGSSLIGLGALARRRKMVA